MPIRFRKDFLKKFSQRELKKIKSYRQAIIVISIITLILNIYVYIEVSYISFNRIGAGITLFYREERQNLINFCYLITVIAIYLTSFAILLHIYLLKFTLNPRINILKARPDEDQKKLDFDVKEYKLSIFYRIVSNFFIIGLMILELNYYPRNLELFKPLVGCNKNTNICVISNEVLYPFIMIMTGFLIIMIIFYFLIFALNFIEIKIIQKVRKPQKVDKKEKAFIEKAKIKKLSIEERKQLKIEELRKKYQNKIEAKKEKFKKKYMDMLHKEQFGKKGFKQLKKEDEGKHKKELKKKKDEFDFT
ncbi:MAG: hypothetical protein ACTSQJ_15965 [Promethearchaeota archaeon]